MNWLSILAISERYVRYWLSDWTLLVRMFYWPLIEIIIMGYTAAYISSPEFIRVTLASAIFWQVVVRVNYEIMENLLLECWTANITNLFASPFTLSEWIVSAALLGLLIQLLIIPAGALTVYLLFGYSFMYLGLYGLLLWFLLFACGFALGLFSCGFIIYKGEAASSFVYMIGWAFALTSGIYFSLDVLPHWFGLFAKSMPLIYGFDLLRAYVSHQQILHGQLMIFIALTAVYLLLATAFFYYQFNRSRARGLAHLTKL